MTVTRKMPTWKITAWKQMMRVVSSAGIALHLAACAASGLTGTLVLADASSGSAGVDLHGRTVSGTIEVRFEPSGEVVFATLRFRLNGEEIPASLQPSSPDSGVSTVTLDTPQLFDGQHVLSVVALSERGSKLPGEVRATFTVGNRGTANQERMPRSGGYILRGDPDFRPQLLSRDMRVWYERTWGAIGNTQMDQVRSGSLRDYGYSLQQHMLSLLTAIRATGDLRLVDELARLGDVMAGALQTDWFDPDTGEWYPPTDGTEGYRRWLYLRDGFEHERVGTDRDTIAAHKAHAVIAIMTYAFDQNRDLASPSAVDYGQRADFWLDYLVGDYEAIWRIRTETPAAPDFFGFGDDMGMSPLHSSLTYHYYLHELTGDAERREYARRVADVIAGAMYMVDTPQGPAFIFSRPYDHAHGLVPIAYARYTWALQVDLALQGHPTFADPEYMAMHARTLARLVMDNGTTDLAFDVGGMRDRTGINWRNPTQAVRIPTQNPYTSSSLEWKRESFNRYMLSYMAPLAAFGSTERIVEITTSVYENQVGAAEDPDALAVPVGLLLAAAFSW